MSDLRTARILVVDDTPENIAVLAGLLKQEYTVLAALNAQQALHILEAKELPDLILLDVMMPQIDGYQLCKKIKAEPRTSHIPIIFVTAKNQIEDEQMGFDIGAVDYITKPISPPIVKARIKSQLALYNQARHLEDLVQQRTQEINDTRLEIIRRLGRAAEYKDNETGMHVIRMSWFAKFLAQCISQPDEWCELLFNAAPMHDIGKIGIPDHILLKPGRLNEAEWEVMKRHAEYGAEIIGEHQSDILKMAKEVAISHHEKWDGTGYPYGLSGENIPLSARIVAIADVFDALTSERPYKKAWPEEEAIKLLRSESGKHFDPNLIEPFISVLPQIRDIQNSYKDTD